MNWILRHPHVLLWLGLAALLAGGLSLGLYAAIRPRRIVPRGAAALPATGFDHEPFGALLERFVDREGAVDYAAWHADPDARAALEAYLATLAAASPASAPERFPSEEARLAYWLNAYNACVVAGVLRHWPLSSVQDVKAPVEVVAGLGFFGTLHFDLGGEWTSLHSLEQERIRVDFQEPRIHFLLNCASGGCPRLRSEPARGPALEAQLEAAAREFINAEGAVQLDDDAEVARLSAIFLWYREDFLAELTRRGLPPSERTLVRYLELYAEPPLRSRLEAARAYRIEALPYDWSLNGR